MNLQKTNDAPLRGQPIRLRSGQAEAAVATCGWVTLTAQLFFGGNVLFGPSGAFAEEEQI